MTDPISCLRRGFIVHEPDIHQKLYFIHCRVCNQGWSLPSDKDIHPGNLLHLLNHEQACAAVKKRKKRG